MKKINLIIVITFSSLIIISCSRNNIKKEKKDISTNVLVIKNDLENAHQILPSWKFENSVLKTNNPYAYSGEYVITLNDTIEFGYTYSEVLKNVDNRIPIMVKYSGYIYTTTPNPKVSIICDIEKDNNKFLRKLIPLENMITKPNEWVEFSEFYHFDKDALDTNMIINIFPWNYGKEQKVLMDDIKITFIYEAKSQFDLGNMYFYGYGVEIDYAKALKFYREAAKKSNNKAQFNLGFMYLNGYAVEQDYAEAIKWYRKAAEQGNNMAQFSLGIMHIYGYGVEKDHYEAVKWLYKSAERHNHLAQYYMGLMYFNGYAVEQDYAEAVKWFRKAAEQSNDMAQFSLGLMYINGYGVEKDYTEALKWYRKAAEQGNNKAQFSLGYMYHYGDDVEIDYTKAVKWYLKSAEQGNVQAQNNLGSMYLVGYGVEEDYDEAVKWFREAAQQGNEPAQNNLERLGETW